MNRAVLVGRLTKDPELKKTNSGSSVVNFTLAINRTYTNANGEREADFINCVAWGRTADNMAAYVSKGSQIGVDGRIQTRSYEADGRRVYVTEVFADNVQFLESKSTGQVNNAQPNVQQNNQQNNDFFADFNQSNNSSEDILSGLDISDDELPF
ncbi:single-strand DNA-binding protein [Bacilli bacterium PM5-3]|nr:single-strand DNA-binding protein [Bacilli bacterium PM5-3]MDH6603376.1 single-strand DNA-binding protein [Bacilli bacterium PM5-9]